MKEYYTPEQVFQTLRRCQEVGINTWQSGVGQIDMYRQFVDQGLLDAIHRHRCEEAVEALINWPKADVSASHIMEKSPTASSKTENRRGARLP